MIYVFVFGTLQLLPNVHDYFFCEVNVYDYASNQFNVASYFNFFLTQDKKVCRVNA